jgi:hypothetical protein
MPDALAKVALPDGRGAGRFSGLAVVAAALGCALVVAGNVAVDPRAEFGSPLGLRPLVLPDSAQAKLDLYDALPAKPDTVILGSSRALPLPPASLPADAFNFAIAGSGVADSVIVYGFLVRDDPALARVVLSVDVFGFSEAKQVRIEASPSYERFTGEPQPGPRARWETLPGTLSSGYTQDTLRVLAYTGVTGYPPVDVALAPDGLWHRPVADRQRALGTYDLEATIAAQYSGEDLLAFAGESSPPDPETLDALQALLEDAARRGVQVDVLLPPYHPSALDLVEARAVFHERLGELRSLLLAHCGPTLEVYDYTDGAAIGLDPDEYYDGHHATPANGARILEAMQAREGAQCGGTDA